MHFAGNRRWTVYRRRAKRQPHELLVQAVLVEIADKIGPPLTAVSYAPPRAGLILPAEARTLPPRRRQRRQRVLAPLGLVEPGLGKEKPRRSGAREGRCCVN